MDAKMEKDTLLYVIIGILLAMLVAYFALAKESGHLPKFLGGDQKPFSLEASPEVADAAKQAAPAVTATDTAVKPLTYEAAVQQYGGYRFQFLNCHGTPGTMTIKVGGKFMLDNRDAVAHTIAVGHTTYKVGAHGFAIAAASSVAGTYNITCDGGGAASLKVQK